MPLTTAQLTALKNDIAANASTVNWQGSPTAINALPNNTDANILIASYYSDFASPSVFGWNRTASVDGILNELNYTNYTPNDDPNQANATAAQVWENRCMLVQVKQINLQLMLQGKTTFDATKTKLRSGLEDATSNLPTGNGGNVRTGGWAAIQPTLSRTGRRIEILLRNTGAGGNGSQATPYTFDYEGSVSGGDVETARNS